MLAGAAMAGQPADDELQLGGGIIHIAMDPDLPLPKPVVVEWIHRAAVAVTGYLGQYPVKQVLIRVKSGGDSPVNHGLTENGSRITVYLGSRARANDLNTDWILTHEMFHLAFPTLNRRYSWMMEGLSDYLEPLARARAGQLSAADVWKGFVEGMPQGLPEHGDQGLDNTPTWGRVYWGGNLYWLLADLGIREKTGNQRSVDDAIRAILDAGGNGGADWSLKKVLAVGDKATGTKVLADLHDQLGSKPVPVDLDGLWKKLGVVYNKRGTVSFDDSVPFAKFRISMTAAQNNLQPTDPH